MNAAFCCASLGIVPTVRHADYIGSWLEVLREDNRAIVRAASQASKAADWLLALLPETDAHGRGLPARDPQERRMILLTEELRERLLANGRERNADHIPVVKFFNPFGNG